MTQTKYPRFKERADVASRRDAFEIATLDSAWRRFRNELDARILERFGLAFDSFDDNEPDPAVLADLALERALMP